MVHGGESRSSIKDGAIDFTAGSLGKHSETSLILLHTAFCMTKILGLFICDFQVEWPWCMLGNH